MKSFIKPNELPTTIDNIYKENYIKLYDNLTKIKENYESDFITCRNLSKNLIEQLKQIRNFNEEIHK